MKNIKKINFNGPVFDALICLYGKLPPKDIFDDFKECTILAADGAGIKLLEKGIMPDYVIGDLDSFFGNPLSQEVESSRIIKITDQETNDFEKNLLFAKENNFKNILILGFHGGELEHSLNNWSVFMRYSKDMGLCIYDEGRYGIPVRESIIFESRDNELISIIPQTYAKIKSNDLQWILNDETLKLGDREGARNVAVKDKVRIDLSEGEYLLFIDARLPYAPALE